MLEWTTAGKGSRLGMIIHHTDAERGFAYDRESHIGKLEKGLDEPTRKAGLSPICRATGRPFSLADSKYKFR